MDSRQSRRNKSIGYKFEVDTANALPWNLTRTGSMAYSKAAADLVTPNLPDAERVVRLIATRDKGQRDILITLSADDLTHIMERGTDEATARSCSYAVVVQCKYRERTWIGGLYRALKEATK